MDGTSALLAVSFGTAAEEARRAELGAVEAALSRRCPELPLVRAYTSPTIRRLLARRGTVVPSLEEALRAQEAAGVERLYVVPTHLLPGWEYDALEETVKDARPRFAQLRLARPLLGDTETVRALAQIWMDRWPREAGQGVVLAGHGTSHPGNLVYSALQGIFSLAGREDILVGTLEGWPGLEDLLPVLRRQGAKRVRLAPLLLTAGTHVREDLAGTAPKSWKSRLEAAGWAVQVHREGLGRLPQVQALYVRRLEELLEGNDGL